MKVAVIGGAGKAGTFIVKEAVGRGYDVTAIVRGKQKEQIQGCKVITKDLFSLSYEDVKEFDVIVDAFGAWTEDTLYLHKTSLAHLTNILKGKKNRLIVVGGAGSLYVDSEHKTRVMDTPDFPDAFIPLATNMGEALDALKQVENVNWTYISPSANFVADGKRTGKYIEGGEELLINKAGQSEISYADYAIALVDEIKKASHIKQRFTVVSA